MKRRFNHNAKLIQELYGRGLSLSKLLNEEINLDIITQRYNDWNGRVDGDAKKEELADTLANDAVDLLDAINAGEFDDIDDDGKTKNKANRLHKALERDFINPRGTSTGETQGNAATKKKTPQKQKEKDKNKFVPDPDPKIGWEYRLENCVWFAREKGKTKEFKLGHANGKNPVRPRFVDSIVNLNLAYPDMVEDCGPLRVKPEKKEPSKTSDVEVKYIKITGGVPGLRNEVMKELVTSFKNLKGEDYDSSRKDVGDPYNAAQTNVFGIKGLDYKRIARRIFEKKQEKSRELTDTSTIKVLIKVLKGKQTAQFGKIVDVLPKVIYYSLGEGQNEVAGIGHVFVFAVTTEETLKTDDKLVIYKFHVGASGNVVGGLNEGKSRGQLYRERYRRY